MRLEYSEEQGCLHINYGNDTPGSNGYETIKSDISDNKAYLFGLFIKYRYGEPPFNLSLYAMSNEWVIFEKFMNLLAAYNEL